MMADYSKMHRDGEGHHVSVKAKDDDILLNSLNVKLKSGVQKIYDDGASYTSLIFEKECCICRVEERIPVSSYSAYTPDIVSIGPIHRGKQNLAAMEQYKFLYVHNLLTRIKTSTEYASLLKEWLEFIKSIEEEARKCYSESIKLSSNEFVEMMLVDGLFVIELFRKNAGEVSIDKDDPLFDNTTRKLSIFIHDLVLLENQLPMLVLTKLIKLLNLHKQLSYRSITMLALKFFNPLILRDEEVLERYSDYEGKHLLDLLGKTIFLALPKSFERDNNSWKSIPSATELKRAGVKLKKGSTNGSFLDIKFRDGVLEIPPLIIRDQTATLLTNLLAFEQCFGGNETNMTSYVILLKSIINSPSDVGFLRNHGIITNYLGDDKDFYNISVKLPSGLNTPGNFYYSELVDQVNTHYQKTLWHVRCATLKRDISHNLRANHFAFILVSVFLPILVVSMSYDTYAGGLPITDHSHSHNNNYDLLISGKVSNFLAGSILLACVLAWIMRIWVASHFRFVVSETRSLISGLNRKFCFTLISGLPSMRIIGSCSSSGSEGSFN